MVEMCGRCGHRVRAEVSVTEGRAAFVYFDDDGACGSYGEAVASCPGCGQSLVGDGLQSSPSATVFLTARQIAEALAIPIEAARALGRQHPREEHARRTRGRREVG